MMEMNDEQCKKLMGFELRCPKCKNNMSFIRDNETIPDFDGNFFEQFYFDCLVCSIIIKIEKMSKKECVPFERIKDLKKKKRWFK